jgi:fructose-1,6-bisphosphatase I
LQKETVRRHFVINPTGDEAMNSYQLMTIERYIMETQKKYPEARGHLSKLLMDIAFAAKIITSHVRRAGLVNAIGYTGSMNIQGEEVKKLDVLSNDVMVNVLNHSGLIAAMASEELEASVPVTKDTISEYVINFDPLDGSSNIDVNVSIGTIFSILRHPRPGDIGRDEDLAQPGYRQVAAGYILYGSSTMMVYTAGDGVHGFTYDPTIGEFLVSHPAMKVPEKGYIYSCNEAYAATWPEGVRQYIEHCKTSEERGDKRYTMRYIGSLVADVHRTLLYGGVFLYPADKKNPKGKLRILYEANPMAMIFENAGGMATNGLQRVMEIIPEGIHDRTPLFVGSKENIRELQQFLKKHDK